MPKHRRRKNQRLLDIKSARNSKLKSKQQSSQNPSEQGDPEADQLDHFDEEVQESQPGSSRQSSVHQESVVEDEEDEVTKAAGTEIPSANTHDNDSVAVTDAISEPVGSKPDESQTQVMVDVAGSNDHQQHQPVAIEQETISISESTVEDRSSSCHQISDKRVDTEEAKTGSKQSTEIAAEPPTQDEPTLADPPGNAETELPIDAKEAESVVVAEQAPSDDLKASQPDSITKDTRSQSQSFSESSDTSTLKDERVVGGGTSEECASSSRSSPDREISNNENATICDITTTTTTVTATTKAFTATSNLLICDNASGTIIDEGNNLNANENSATKGVEVEGECNEGINGVRSGIGVSKDVGSEGRSALSLAASSVTETMTRLCTEILTENELKETPSDPSGTILQEPSPAEEKSSSVFKPSEEPTEDLGTVTEDIINVIEKSPPNNTLNTSTVDSILDPDKSFKDVSSVDLPNEKSESKEKPSSLPNSDVSKSTSADSIGEPPKSPIRHAIVQEVVSILFPSRVDSPKPMRSKRTKTNPLAKSKSLDDDDLMIQEMSDTSSTGDLTDNPPLVSEASESEADTDTATSEFEETLDPRILSVQTLPLENSTPADAATSENDENRNQPPDAKIRRARNRAALEMHFLPQFLNPRYLDSIKEENSDNSDLESKSPTRYHSTSSLGDLEDEIFGSPSLKERRSSAPSTPKADAVFPKSSLDFSQKHKHLSNLKSPQTGVIREESPCLVVETKIIEPAEVVEERCSEWTTKLIATSSDAAEVVYIDSASSSSSDLMELDYTDSTIPSDTNEDDSSETVHIHTPTIEATEDTNSIFGDPEKTPTREIPEIVDTVRQRLENAALEEKLLNDLKQDYEELQNYTKPNEFQHHDYNANHLKDYCEQPVANYAVSPKATAIESTLNSNNLTESFSSNRDTLTSASSLNEKQLLREPDVGQSAVESETLIYNKSSSSNSEQQSSIQKIDFKIGGPCSINMFASLYSPLANNNNNNNSEGVSSNPVVSSNDSSKLVFNEIINERGELVRQDSSGSHCSAQSQNTVIHKGSSNEFGEAGQAHHVESLRQLCLDTLQDMPYGKVVLEELAAVAQTLNTLTDKHQIEQELKLREVKKVQEMPFPRPELPKISDLIVPKRPEVPASHVKLMSALPTKLPSPPPPPIPDRPKITSSWIGVPTEQDPNVLVCLSPAQRDYMNNASKNQKSRQEPTPDVLLDMHRKFVERRGYHELPSELVEKIDQRRFSTEKLSQVVSSPQLRKSTSPPPVPPPPAADLLTDQTNTTTNISPPQNSHTNSERGDDRVTDDEHAEQNKHRLLAIIRDSKQSFSSGQQSTQEKVQNLEIINNSKQLSSPQSQAATSDVKISEKCDENLSNSSDRQPPQVPPRTSSSDPRLHGASSSTPRSNPASTPRSNPTSEMSASTNASFDGSFWENPFNFDTSDFRKRFSNIENISPFCSQLRQTQPKRFSAVETTTSTSQKRIENGKVVLDISDTSKEKVVSGDELPANETSVNGERKIGESFPSSFKVKPDNDDRKTVQQPSQPQPQQQQPQQTKLFPCEAPKTERKIFEQTSQQHESRQEQHESTKTFNQMFENRSKVTNGATSLSQEKKQDNFAYDEFRQRAKDSAAERAKSEFLERQNYLLKDFDELTKLIKEDLFTTESASKVSKTETTSTIKEPQKTGASFVESVKNTPSTSTQESSPRVHTVPIQVEGERKVVQEHVENKTHFETKEHKVYTVPIVVEGAAKPEQQTKTQFPCNSAPEPKVRTIPIQVEPEQLKSKEQFPVKNEDHQQRATTFKTESTNSTNSTKKEEFKERRIPIKVEGQPPRPHSSLGNLYTFTQNSQSERHQNEGHKERTIPIHVENQHPRPNSSLGSPYTSTQASQSENRRQRYFSERRLSSQDLDEWMKYVEDLGASSENITKPLMKEVELCAFGRRSNIRAPRVKEETGEKMTSRFSQSTSNLSSTASDREHFFNNRPFSRTESMIDTTPSPFIRPGATRQTSVPKEVFSSQIDYIRQKEAELREEFERLESDRRRVMEEMNEMAQRNRLRKDIFFHRSCRLPTLSEEEAFRQQMHDEWRNKVAEREERRMQKIIKVTGSSDAPEVPSRSNMSKAASTSNISDEFLRRVKERRSKLAMPADSDWESGAESQPAPRQQQEKSPPHVKVIQGQSECDFKNLPPHLREFAEITNQMIEQHYHEEQVSSTTERKTVTESSSSSGAGVAKKDGVWTPNNKADSSAAAKNSTTTKSGPTSSSAQTPPPPPPPPVWSPQPSPTPARKEFRPVKFESPVLPRKYTAQRQDSNPVTPPWANGNSKPLYNTQSSSCTNLTNTGNYYSGANQQQQQQQYQQYNIRKSESVGGNLAPRPTVYQLKNEYMSEPESENDRPRKMAQLARRKFDGIGPTTKEGMPIVLRSEVKENNQHQWYKRMYNTLHKAKNDGRYPYRANGYMSEPEPNYDSDYSTTTRYHTLDRRRIPSTGSYQEERTYGTMPNPVRSSTGSYKNQPGRIENYIPGHSSVSDKEKKEWWDEVMDIFDGHLEQQKLSSNYTEGYLSRALKEEGYESDPNLVFKKRNAPQYAPLSPIEQKQAYRNLQAGGEPPLQGFKRPAPEKPKEHDVDPPPPPPPPMKLPINFNYDSDLNSGPESPRRYVEGDVNIHYKSPIRYEYKDAIPEEELARKQAESMKQLYSEERRRKYLQELEDMSNRRHTDNFIPSQKSPIPLNRYDDFPTDVSPKSPAPVNLSRTVARALYNFQGQTARELSFKKGDVIYIRKQIDKNWYEGEYNAMVGLLPVNYVEIISKDGMKPMPQKKPSEGQARAKYNFSAASSVELSLNKGELVTLIKRVDENWFEGKIANRKGIFPVAYVEVLTDIGTEDNNNRLSAGGNNYASTVTNKPIGAPASRALYSTSNISPTLDQLRASINHEYNHVTNGGQHPNGILRETKASQKTEVLHIDTNSEPRSYRAIYKYYPQNNDELELLEGDIVQVLEKCDDGWYVGTSQRTGHFGTFPGNYVQEL